MPDVTVQELAPSIIALAEGCRLTAYRDSGGIWTIGIGHTKGVTEGMTCTIDQAQQWFAEDSAHLFTMVAGMPLLSATAYVSFGYNCGAGALQKVLSGMDTINNPRHATDAKGNTLSGLVNRRRLEELLIASAEQ